MLKFKVLQSNQCFMSSILRIDGETHNFFASVPVLLILFIQFSTMALYAVRISIDSHDFTTRLTAILMLVAMGQATAMFLNVGVNMQKISALYQTLQSIVGEEGIFFVCFRLNLAGIDSRYFTNTLTTQLSLIYSGWCVCVILIYSVVLG